MKVYKPSILLAISVWVLCWALNASAVAQSLDSEATITEIGPDYKMWAPPSAQRRAAEAMVEDRKIVQVETGMNYWTGTEWAPSEASFEVTDDAFVATRMQYKVRLDAFIDRPGAVSITTRDNVVLQSTPVAIGLYDTQSGKSVIVSAITNATGVLVKDNAVLFENAFAGVAADVLYTINKGSFEQDVIITGALNPGDYGMPTNTTRVQIYTEFFNAPEPERIRRPLRVEENQAIRQSMATPDLVDEVLGFGEFVLPTGRAAIGGIDQNSDASAAPVIKEFRTVENRRFLIESVDYIALYPDKLTASVKRPADSRTRTVAKLSIPTVSPKQLPTPPMDSRKRMMAALNRKKGDIIIDYVGTIGPGFTTPTTFQGDTTYLVTGAVTCNSATKMEGGAIFKYKYISGTSTAYIQLNNTLTTTSSSHRPIIFTGVDDDSVGETMNGVTGSGYAGSINSSGYANPALLFNSTSQTITDVRFRYCQEAIRVSNSTGSSISHAQLVNCIKGIVITGCGAGCGTAITVKNALFSSVTYPLTSSWSRWSFFQHCTIDNTPRLITDSASAPCSFVNCVFANVTALYSGSPSISGNNNGFYLAPTLGTSTTTVTSSPFEQMQAGNYYLSSSCAFRNIGTTSIDSGLATDLKSRTVDPPIAISGTLSGTLHPTALPDSNTPDLGYHYDRVDYIGSELAVSSDGNPLYLTNGVVMAFYGNYGIQVPENGAVIGQGTPILMNRFLWYPAVQEQPTLLGGISTRGSALFDVTGATSGNATKPILQFRFTDFPMQGLRQDFFKSGSAHPLNLKTLSFQDCWLRGVNLVVSSTATSFGSNPTPTASLVNNLFERSTVSLFNGYLTSGSTYQNPMTVSVYNGLFWESTLTLEYRDASATSHPTWTIRDNVFDHGTVSLTGDGSYATYVTPSYDGFFSTTGSAQLAGTGDVTITVLTYSTGANGWRWYQNSRTPTLHDVDTGRTGGGGGLYHYTTKVSEGKETTSNMDLGFHYVVLGAGNVPNDADSDGIPDYLEDANGDGSATGDATDWQTYNSPNGLSGTTGLQTFTPLK